MFIWLRRVFSEFVSITYWRTSPYLHTGKQRRCHHVSVPAFYGDIFVRPIKRKTTLSGVLHWCLPGDCRDLFAKFFRRDDGVNPKGDLLAISAAAVWALYSILMREIGKFGFPTIFVTRKIFGFGILFMLPALLFESCLNWQRIFEPVFFFNLLFLGLGASAMCFVTWNFAVKVLGAVKTSVYIYLVPVITVLCSVVVLHETISTRAALGILLTLIGLLLSEINSRKK